MRTTHAGPLILFVLPDTTFEKQKPTDGLCAGCFLDGGSGLCGSQEHDCNSLGKGSIYVPVDARPITKKEEP
jgi:hypothetical protein